MCLVTYLYQLIHFLRCCVFIILDYLFNVGCQIGDEEEIQDVELLSNLQTHDSIRVPDDGCVDERSLFDAADRTSIAGSGDTGNRCDAGCQTELTSSFVVALSEEISKLTVTVSRLETELAKTVPTLELLKTDNKRTKFYTGLPNF
mgnify:FL=1